MKSRSLIAMGVLLVASVALLVHTLIEPDGWRRRQRIKADLEALKQENARLEQQVSRLRREIHALRTRADVQAHVVRDELGYVGSDEVILELSSP